MDDVLRAKIRPDVAAAKLARCAGAIAERQQSLWDAEMSGKSVGVRLVFER
jgi:hypothetical protein